MTAATERVGRYQLLEPIGVGPDGTVSRAKVFGVAGFERQFAVKRFHPELTTTATMAQALSAAARAYGGLEHPRIARMSEFGVAQGTTFTAVEHVAGLDALRLVMESRTSAIPLAAGGALALVSQAARAVGYAHGRGLTHLGLAPTNVIITADGDVKITDFGILSATLPSRPLEQPRLAHRLAYLAPEQLANEATSAATDVFALGVLAHELVTGQRAFRGDTPQQIAQAVMSGPPGEPPLPRPIVRVLQRCLARSPFERFPDARALADALDAALRVAPVPGTRKDIGAQVKAALDRADALHSGEVSGMLALDLGTANMLRGPVAPVAALGARDLAPPRESQAQVDLATTEFVRGSRPSVPALEPPPLRDLPSTTLPDLPKMPMTTVTGLAPPPIPVPKGIGGPASPPPPTPPSTGTLLGLSNTARPKAVIPEIPSARIPPMPPRAPTPPPETADPGGLDDGAGTVVQTPPPPRAASRAETGPALRAFDEAPERPSETPVSPLRMLEQMPSSAAAPVPLQLDDLLGDSRPDTETALEASSGVTNALEALDRPTTAREDSQAIEVSLIDQSSDEPPMSERPSSVVDTGATNVVRPPETDALESVSQAVTIASPDMSPLLDAMRDDLAIPPASPAPPPAAKPESPPRISQIDAEIPSIAHAPVRQVSVQHIVAPVHQSVVQIKPRKRPSRAPAFITLFVLLFVLLGGLAAAGYFLVLPMFQKDEGGAIDAAVASTGGDAGATTNGDARAVAMTGDAGAVEIDASPDAATAVGDLNITSTPAGARVFIDGADAGTTPVTQPGTADRHTVALLLAGHELYVAQVDGRGAFEIPLKEVTPSGGPAGIKVIQCKAKDRYYVFVDGKPTGQTCPTERIECEMGPHTVEVYDVVSETRRKWEIVVTETRLSYRVRID